MANEFVDLSGAEILYDDLRKRAASADENMAEYFSTTKRYAVGDMCMYQDKLYKCTTAVTNAGAWNANNWTQVKAGAEFSALNDEVSDLKSAIDAFFITNREAVTWSRGALNSSTGAETQTNKDKRCRSDRLGVLIDKQIVISDGESRFSLYFYSGAPSSATFIGKTDWLIFCDVADYVSANVPSAVRFRVLGSMTDDGQIGDGESADVSECTNHIFVLKRYSTGMLKKLSLDSTVEQIVSGTDLDSLTAPGNYRAVTFSIVQSLVHCPTISPFRLTVEQLTTVDRYKQTIVSIAGATFERIYSGSWSNWVTVATEIIPIADDVTSAIAGELQNRGFVNLTAGTYIIHDLVMPSGSRINGCGNGTILQLNTNYATSFAVKMQAGCSISGVKIIGAGGDSYTPNGVITSSHGIFVNTYGESDNDRNRINIDSVEICGFSGGGMCFDSTGLNYDNSANVVNCYTHNNNVGIYIPLSSEFNRFTNVQNGRNYYGCINNGGNNVFVNCGFNGNVQGLLMDNTNDSAPNNAHGSFVGCTFNHSGDNSGKAVEIIGMKAGEVFSACQFFYGTITLTDSKGVQFNGCNFGNASGIIASGGANLMIGCVQKSRAETPITLTNSAIFHAVNCYSREGNVYTDFP